MEKTHYILFRSKHKSVPILKTKVKIMMNVLRKCNTFPGIIVDYHLNWSKHINYIKSKVSNGRGITNMIKQVVNKKTITTLNFLFVYPYLYYCIKVLGNAQDCYGDTTVKLQKRSDVSVISCSPLSAHSEPLFIHLLLVKWRQFKKNCFYTVAIFM